MQLSDLVLWSENDQEQANDVGRSRLFRHPAGSLSLFSFRTGVEKLIFLIASLMSPSSELQLKSSPPL